MFKFSDADVLGSLGDYTALRMKQKAVTDRWVNAINKTRIGVNETVFCRYCGAKNSIAETKCVNCGALLS